MAGDEGMSFCIWLKDTNKQLVFTVEKGYLKEYHTAKVYAEVTDFAGNKSI